jgi:phage baseplate assembly protein W
MSNPLYNKPLRFSNISVGHDLDKQDLGVSISQFIELIIFTRYGEHRYNPEFGCEIWDMDFELIISETIWEEKLRQSLIRAVKKFEKRIYDVDVDVNISEINKFYPLRNVSEIKKKVELTIKGKLNKTGEKYSFKTSLYLSPLSA